MGIQASLQACVPDDHRPKAHSRARTRPVAVPAEVRVLFYITNDRTSTPAEIVFSANNRCDQETISCPARVRCTAGGAGGQPDQQRGVHGDGVAGVEPQGVAYAMTPPSEAVAREASRRAGTGAADGVRDVPNAFMRIPARSSDRTQARRLVWGGRARQGMFCWMAPRSPPASLLKNGARSRSPDAPVRRHAQPRKELKYM